MKRKNVLFGTDIDFDCQCIDEKNSDEGKGLIYWREMEKRKNDSNNSLGRSLKTQNYKFQSYEKTKNLLYFIWN